MKKNLLFLFIFLVAFFGGFGAWTLQPLTAHATSPDASIWDGKDVSNVTADDWFEDGSNFYIRSANGLVYFAQTLSENSTYGNSTIFLETDIDLNQKSWAPMKGQNFSGTFDGQGHTIYNLNVSTSNDDSAGFFAVLGGGLIRNLNFSSATVSSSATAGMLAGETNSTKVEISNCSFQGKVSGNIAGGVVGNGNIYTDGILSNAEVEGKKAAGGIVGQTQDTTILKAANVSTVKVSQSTEAYVGGIVGLVDGNVSIQDSYNIGNVSAQADETDILNIMVGGLVGESNGQTSISHSYVSAQVEDLSAIAGRSNTYLGGLVGYAQGTSLTLSNNFYLGQDTTIVNLSAVLSKTIRNTYSSADKQNTTQSYFNFLANLDNLAKTESFYADVPGVWNEAWDFSSTWQIHKDVNSGLPTLKFAFSNGDVTTGENLVGDGTQNNPYQIKTAGDLAFVSTNVNSGTLKNKCFVLMNDIDLSGKVWQPIGSEGTPFSGVFDGNGHKIFNLKTSTHETFGSYGLFGATNNAVIKDLTVSDFVFDIQNETTYVGNIVGKSANTYIINCQDKTEENNVTKLSNQSKVDANSVGVFAEGRNYVIYGDYGISTLDLQGTYNTGYDIQVLGNGGVFYDKSETMIFGEYHVLVEESGEDFQPIEFNENLKYYTFYHSNVGEGKLSFLPGVSSDVARPNASNQVFSKDVLIKVGSMPTGWVYASDNLSISDDFDVEKAIFGVKRTWQDGATRTVKVVYNEFEANNYEVSEYYQDYIDKRISGGQQTETIQRDAQNRIFVTYSLPYDSKFCDEINKRLFDTPKYAIDGNLERYLRNGEKNSPDDFSVENLYEVFSVNKNDFENIINKNSFVNFAETEKTVYAKWTASSEAEIQLNMNFTIKTGNWQGEEIDVDLSTVVKRVTLTKTNGGAQEEIVLKEVGGSISENTISAGLTFDDTYFGNFVQIELLLENGYTISGNRLSTLESQDKNFGDAKVVDVIAGQNKWKFENFNINQDYQIEITHQTYSDILNISDDACFGFAAPQKLVVTKGGNEEYSSNLKLKLTSQGNAFIADENHEIDFVEILKAAENGNDVLEELVKNEEGVFVAFDHNGRIIFSDEQTKVVQFDWTQILATEIGLRFTFDNEGQKFTYSLKQRNGETSNVVFSQILDDIAEQEKQIAVYTELSTDANSQQSNLQYLSWTDFEILVAVDDEAKKLTDSGISSIECFDPGITNSSSAYGQEINDSQKYIFEFEEVRKNKNTQVTFKAITAYSFASVEFKLQFKDAENIPNIFNLYLPTVEAEKRYDVTTNGDIRFSITQSDYFKWAGNNSNFWGNVKVSVANTESPSFETKFNSGDTSINYQKYFSTSYSHSTGKDELTLGFSGRGTSGSNFNLQPGLYTFTFYCDYVDYTISLKAGKILFDEAYNQGYDNLLNSAKNSSGLSIGIDGEQRDVLVENMTLKTDSSITGERVVSGGDFSAVGSSLLSFDKVHFDDEISIEFSSGLQNLKLFGFLVNGQFFGSTAQVGENLFNGNVNFTFSSNSMPFSGLQDNATVEIKMIFVVKHADIYFDSNVLVENIEDEQQSLTQISALGINFAFRHSQTNENLTQNSIGFDFSTNESSTSLQTTILLSNGNGFKISDVQVGAYEGGLWEEVSFANLTIRQDAENWEINYSALQEYMKTICDSQQLYIRPVLERKDLEIIFSSGTKATFGDQLDKISDINGNTTTNTEVSVKVKYGASVLLPDLRFRQMADAGDRYLFDDAGDLLLTDIFSERKGFEGTDYWENDQGRRFVGQFDAAYEFFGAHDENVLELSRIWTANFYNIVFKVDDEIYVTKRIEFGQSKPDDGWPNNPIKTGHNFDGWFDEAGDVVLKAGVNGLEVDEKSTYFSSNDLLWSHDGDVELDAQFSAMILKVRVVFNSNYGNLSNSVFVGDGGVQYAIFDVVYGTKFQLSGGEFLFDGKYLKEINPTRPGFILRGYGILNENNIVAVDDQTVFDILLPTFSRSFKDEDEVLTLYLVWDYANGLSYSFTESLVEKTYNGALQSVNVLKDFGFVGNFEDQPLGQGNRPGTDLENAWRQWFESLVPEGSNISLSKDASSPFVVSQRDSGYYAITFELTLSDNDMLFAGKQLLSQRFTLTYSIIQATLSYQIEIDKLQNAKRLMQPFVDVASANSFTQLGILAGLTSEDLQQINSASQSADDEIYQFILAKYFNMISTNDFELHNTYKLWTYQDFARLSQLEREDILSHCQPFAFFNYETYDYVLNVEENDLCAKIGLNSPDVQRISFDIEAIEIVSDIFKISAGQSYQMRLEISGADIDNFTGYEIVGEKYYLNVGSVYVMPQILVLQNLSENNTAFYSALYQTREVELVLGDKTDINGQKYFDITPAGDVKLYAKATLETNNAGSSTETTSYTFGDQVNFLNLKNISVLLQQDQQYLTFTQNFKLVLSDSFEFQILSTKEVVYLSVAAKYLTLEDGYISYETVTEGLASGLLTVESVTYDGGVLTPENGIFEEKVYYTPDGTLLCEILANEQNEISLYISGSVKAIRFAVKSTELSNHIALARWESNADYTVYGDMASTNTYDLEMSTIEKSQDLLTNEYLYAVYTDLVKVDYIFNFPAGYEPEISTTNLLKLGESKIDDISMPKYLSFTCTELTYLDANFMECDYTQLFANGTFEGLPTNKYGTVTLYAKWTLDPELSVYQNSHLFQQAVGSMSQLTVDQVAAFLTDLRMFTYSYKWFKEDSQISVSDTLTFAEGGLRSDNGDYKLTITATLTDEFLELLDNPADKTSSCTLDFEVQFELYKLISVTFNDVESFTYDGEVHNNFTAVAQYSYFDNNEAIFITRSENLTFGAAGLFSFDIKRNGEAISQIKDVGDYSIKLLFNEEMVELDEDFDAEQSVLSFSISPKQIDLLDFGFTGEKKFNEDDPRIERQISATITDMLTVSLSPEGGEEVKNGYALYLESFVSGNPNNFDFYAGDVLVFSNGQFTQNGHTTKVGTFDIVASTTLRLNLQGLTSNLLTAPYRADGYTAQLVVETNENQELFFEIVGTDYKYKVSFYDENTHKTVSNQTILQIILNAIGSAQLKFYSSEEEDKAVSCGRYSFTVVPNDFTKYYSYVSFDANVVFEIEKITINVPVNFAKVYDGETVSNYKVEVDQDKVSIDASAPIANFDEYHGMYVVANFTSWHAGETSVSLNLSSTEEDDVQNYQLATQRSKATISKLSAQISLTSEQSSYEYGDLSSENLLQYISLDKLTLRSGARILSAGLLVDGFFNLKLSSNAPKTAEFFDAGQVEILTTGSTFDDFEMTISPFSLTITKLNIPLEIMEGFITITTEDSLQDFYEKTVDAPGEGITIKLVPFTADGQKLARVEQGKYKLAFEDVDGAPITTLQTKNCIITLSPQDNLGFVIVPKENIYTLTILGIDASNTIVLEYRGQNNPYTFSISNGNLTIGDKTFALQITSALGDPVDADSLGKIRLYSGVGTASWTDVSIYELEVEAAGHSVAFAQPYKLEITQKNIDPRTWTQQERTKFYDGNSDYRNDMFTGKFAGDDVYAIGHFGQSNAGKDLSLSLEIQGKDRANYKLLSSETTGEIKTVVANIVLQGDSFVYGEVVDQDGQISGLSFDVVANGVLVDKTQYSLVVEVLGSKSGIYFTAGVHEINVTAQAFSGDVLNYEITPLQTSITIDKYPISVVFYDYQAGLISKPYGTVVAGEEIEYNSYRTDLQENITLWLTREDSQNINPGYYKIIGARTENQNYQVVSVRDESEGAFQITRQSEIVYVLSQEGTDTITTEFDGNTYDTLQLSMSDNNVYLVLTNSQDRAVSKSVRLGLFVQKGGSYVAFDSTTYGEIKNLSSVLSFIDGSVRNARDAGYEIRARSTTSDTHQIRVGFGTGLYELMLKINPRDIYFKENILYETFKNEDAKFTYSNKQLSEMFVDKNEKPLDADLTISVTFTNIDGSVAKYSDIGYGITAEIVEGADKTNFVLHTTTADGGALQGVINPAEVQIILNSTTINYGQQVTIDWDIVGFDVRAYLSAKPHNREFTAEPKLNISNSSSNNQKAGNYSLQSFTFMSNDFTLKKDSPYVIDGVETDDITLAKITINPLELQIQSNDPNFNLQQIFTKDYDGDNLVHNLDKLTLSGVLGGDHVSLANAEYKSRTTNAPVIVGNGFVYFTLTGTAEGDDAQNYVINPYADGYIKPLHIGLTFEFDRFNYYTNVPEANWLKALSFPFVNASSLSANAQDSSANVFVNDLVGNGLDFTGWTLDFATSGESNTYSESQIIYLQGLVDNFGLSATNKTVDDVSYYSIWIENNKKAVDLLRALVSEDEDNVMGFYFKDNKNIAFVLNANFVKKDIEIKVVISPANMAVARVQIDGQEVEQVITGTYGFNVKFGSQILIRAVANEHCTFENFYYNGNPLVSDGNFEVGMEQDGITRYISFVVNADNPYTLEFRYSEQVVTTKVDVSESDATLSYPQFVLEDGIYTRNFAFSELSNLSVSALASALSKLGSNLVSIEFSYDVNGLVSQNVDLAEFDSTKMTFLLGNISQNLTLTLVPKFEKISVKVTLKYGYDKANDVVTVEYDQLYTEAIEKAGLSATPTREGYQFMGWAKNGVLLSASSTNTEITDHSLQAQWSILSYNITLTLNHLTISNVEGASFTNSGNVYTAKVEFASTISFVLQSEEGYKFSSSGVDDLFDITENGDGSALIQFVVPASDVQQTFSATPNSNNGKITGDHIAEIVVTDISETQNLEVTENSFLVLTDHDLSIKIVAAEGFHMMAEIVVDGKAVATGEVDQNGALLLEVSNIKGDFEIQLVAEENFNIVTLEFQDLAMVDHVVINGSRHETDDLDVEVLTEQTLEIYVYFKFGFEFKDVASSDFVVSHEPGEGSYDGLERVEVSNIYKDGRVFIEHQCMKFEIEVHTLTFIDNQNPVLDMEANVAYIKLQDGQTASGTFDYQQTIELVVEYNLYYQFLGWYENDRRVSGDEHFAYTVNGPQVLYARFRPQEGGSVEISFGTVNIYQTGLEYNSAERVVSHYDKFEDSEFLSSLAGNKYLDGETELEIDKFALYFGMQKTIIFEVPEGFEYRGFGYFENENDEASFVYFSISPSEQTRVFVNISSDWFGAELAQKIYFVVASKQVKINAKSFIEIEGEMKPDTSASLVQLVSKDENETNNFGYIEDTRIHYTNRESDQEFDAVAYTGDEVYLLASVQRAGFQLVRVQLDNQDVKVETVHQNELRALFKLSGLVGGMEIGVSVVVRPIANIINLSFVTEDLQDTAIDGGSFIVKVDSQHSKSVRYSGFNTSNLVVSAYTDSKFVVEAYVKEGYLAKAPYVIANGEIVFGITFEALSVTDTGFNGRIVFAVENFLDVNNIKIVLVPQTYRVVFKNESQTVATLDGVLFGQMMDVSELSLVIKKQNYNFEGYFSHQNGQGIRYINSDGNAENVWLENGYTYSSLTGKWGLSTTASWVTTESGESIMQIVLYAYHSYMKTRVSFELVPNISTSNITAQNIVGGVTPYTSWFNKNMPMYMEIAYNTPVQFTAPQFDVYMFYKFVISQRKFDGTWLDDVETTASSIPWISSDLDGIVECEIKIIYFSKVDVSVVGGDAEYEIVQEDSDAQASILIQQGYVDTTKSFEITAKPLTGYTFSLWTNLNTGFSTRNVTLTVRASSQRVALRLTVVGNEIPLDFSKYDTSVGQIISMTTTAKNGIESAQKFLGSYSDDIFIAEKDPVIVRVGEIVKLCVSLPEGYSVAWNDEISPYITYSHYSGGVMYFNFEILPELETYMKGHQLSKVPILPTFDNEYISLYIQTDFVDSNKLSNPLDNNDVDFAGEIIFGGEKVKVVRIAKGNEIRLLVLTNPRYAVASITLTKYNSLPQELTLNENNEIVMPEDLEGVANLKVEFMRLHWHDAEFEKTALDGAGIADNPYKISSVEDLILMERLVNSGQIDKNGLYYRDAHYVLTTNIDLSERFWTPIGNATNPFNGTFDFKGHAITGIYLDQFYQPISYGGLFGVLGANASIISEVTSIWWLWLIIGIVLLLAIILVLLVLYARKRKKLRQKLANK